MTTMMKSMNTAGIPRKLTLKKGTVRLLTTRGGVAAAGRSGGRAPTNQQLQCSY